MVFEAYNEICDICNSYYSTSHVSTMLLASNPFVRLKTKYMIKVQQNKYLQLKLGHEKVNVIPAKLLNPTCISMLKLQFPRQL